MEISTISNPNLIEYAKYKNLLKQAYTLAQTSVDGSTQNAAIIVDNNNVIISTGINRLPTGTTYHRERLIRPIKYKYMEHAERNAIYSAAKKGKALENKIMICPWASCADCARAIIESGIRKLVVHKQAMDKTPDRWFEDLNISKQLFEEAGVEVIYIDDKISEDLAIRFDGEIWVP